jgi:hypothetical protein
VQLEVSVARELLAPQRSYDLVDVLGRHHKGVLPIIAGTRRRDD